MTHHHLLALALLVASARTWAWPRTPGIKNIVTFGDSFTDSTVFIPTNGTTWPQYTAAYAGLTLYPFAISGATCNNAVAARIIGDVNSYQLEAYLNLTANGTVVLDPKETLYTLWIGTNDLGAGSMLTGQGVPGATIVDVAACAVNWISTLYGIGARNFLFQNMIPLDLAPLYSANSYPNHIWSAERNTTMWNSVMRQFVAAGNSLTQLMITTLAPILPDATIGYFDSHALFRAMYTSPSLYLNGTAPLNVTAPVVSCIFAEGEPTSDAGDCTIANGTDRDSFLWHDELHPSEQADRVVARAVANLIQGKTQRWTTFYKGPTST